MVFSQQHVQDRQMEVERKLHFITCFTLPTVLDVIRWFSIIRCLQQFILCLSDIKYYGADARIKETNVFTMAK